MAVYFERGEALDYKNETTELIKHGDVVVLGSKIGVAGCDIKPSEAGSLHVMGVYIFEGTGLTAGQYVKFDTTNKTVVPATDVTDAHGWAVYASENNLTHVKID